MSEVVALARQASAASDYTAVMDLLDTRPLEMWFGFPSQELGLMLTAIPPDVLHGRPSAYLVVNGFFTPEPDAALADPAFAAAAEASPVLRSWQQFGRAWRMRTGGDVVTAYGLMREMPEVASSVPQRIDQTSGMRALLLTQAGLSAILAGEFVDALNLYEKVVLVPPTPGLEFFAREAHVRAALIHGLYGDDEIARIHRDRAADVPRTTSWADTELDREQVLLDALLAPDEEAATAVHAVLRLTYGPMAETWPLYVAVLQRLALITGERRVARDRLEALRATGLGDTAHSGYAGSIFGQQLALDSILVGNIARAREEIAEADPAQWLTQQIECVIALRSSAPRRAVQIGRSMSSLTRGLRRADRRRVLLLALGYLGEGQDDEAVSLLASVSSEIELSDVRLLALLSPRARDLAAARVPGWPQDEADSHTETDLPEPPRLTPSEIRVLEGLSRGRTRGQIAQDLFVSENTVKTHQRAVYRKLGAGTAEQAVRVATEFGMI